MYYNTSGDIVSANKQTRQNAELKAMLKELGLTHDDFAKLVGTHRTTVSRWVCGEVPTPQYVDVVLVALHRYRELMRLRLDVLDAMEMELNSGKKSGRLGENTKLEDVPEFKNLVGFVNRLDAILEKHPISNQN